MLTLLGRLQRAVIVALLVLPLLLLIVLSSPIWFTQIFTESGRKFLLDLVDKMADCLKTLAKADESEIETPEDQPKIEPSGAPPAIPPRSETERKGDLAQ